MNLTYTEEDNLLQRVREGQRAAALLREHEELTEAGIIDHVRWDGHGYEYDTKILQKAKNKGEEALEQLLNSLADTISRSLPGINSLPANIREQLLEESYADIAYAITRYKDNNQGRLRTFAANYARWKTMDRLNENSFAGKLPKNAKNTQPEKAKLYSQAASLSEITASNNNEPVYIEEEIDHTLTLNAMLDTIKKYKSELDAVGAAILDNLLCGVESKPLTQEEMCRKLKINTSTYRRQLTKIQKNLRKILEKNELI